MISDQNKRAVEAMHGDLGMSHEEIEADFRSQNLRISAHAVKSVCEEMDGKQSKPSKTKMIEFRGVTMPICEWAEVTGISANTISKRIHAGWDIPSVMTTPVRKLKNNRSKYTTEHC